MKVTITTDEIKKILAAIARINALKPSEIEFVESSTGETIYALPQEPPGWTIDDWEMTGLTTLDVLHAIMDAWEEKQKSPLRGTRK